MTIKDMYMLRSVGALSSPSVFEKAVMDGRPPLTHALTQTHANTYSCQPLLATMSKATQSLHRFYVRSFRTWHLALVSVVSECVKKLRNHAQGKLPIMQLMSQQIRNCNGPEIVLRPFNIRRYRYTLVSVVSECVRRNLRTSYRATPMKAQYD